MFPSALDNGIEAPARSQFPRRRRHGTNFRLLARCFGPGFGWMPRWSGRNNEAKNGVEHY